MKDKDWPAHPMDGDEYLCYVCSCSLVGELFVLLTDWGIGVGGEAYTHHDMSSEEDGDEDPEEHTCFISGLCVHAKCLPHFLEMQLMSERAYWKRRRRQQGD